MHQQRGFTLVELSIVLVILGLLIGGVLTGQSLIRAAELRSITTQYSRYVAAIQTFRDKYFALPGDMTNATLYWGKSATYCNSASGAAATLGTCNGDGDGILNYGAGASTSSEAFRGWQHLALAGLVEGSYTGVSGSVTQMDYDVNINCPAGKMSGTCWGLTNYDNSSGANASNFNYNYLNWITIGGDDGSYADLPFMKPEDGYNIDSKMDDGMPGQGRVHSWRPSGCTTATSTSDRAAKYDLTQTGNNCSLFFQW